MVNTFRIDNQGKFASGCLYIISTPIGNMGDISQRALEILKSVSYIICEDSRVTGKLLAYHGIKKPMIVCNDYTEKSQVAKVINLLQAHQDIALVSDAGTPLISDPGYLLARSVKQAGLALTTIPGPCAVIAALTVSGLPTDRFTFIGFLDSKQTARRKALQEIAEMKATIVCFDTTQRLIKTLQDMHDILGDRSICMARELTKTYEEIWHGNITELLAHCQQHQHLKGEVVLVIAGNTTQVTTDAEIVAALQIAMQEYSHSQAVEQVTTAFGIQRRRVYQLALKLARR